MQEPRSFAYSLSQEGENWRWRVYDEAGVAVAAGERGTQAAAMAAVKQNLTPPGGDLAMSA